MGAFTIYGFWIQAIASVATATINENIDPPKCLDIAIKQNAGLQFRYI